jgi:hypothetical protein
MPATRQLVKEQSTGTVSQYRRRVYRLAGTYAGILLTATLAIVLIVVQGEFFVTLSQRSNVETLTLAVVIVLFAYLAVVSAPGAWGALRIVHLNLPAWIGRDRAGVEARKQAALKPLKDDPPAVMLNCAVHLRGHGDDPVVIPLEDDAGSLGAIVVDGVRMTHKGSVQAGSNSVFAFFERHIEQLAREHDPKTHLQIVQWQTIDDEAALQYESIALFSRNLQRHLDSGPLWPVVELREDDLEALKREARELCPALRNEAHLPDLEYEVEYRLPIIPEPLGFIALSRTERRADPGASMGCALLVTLGILALVVLFNLVPPWVPGKWSRVRCGSSAVGRRRREAPGDRGASRGPSAPRRRRQRWREAPGDSGASYRSPASSPSSP